MHPYMSLAKSLDVGVKYNTYCLKGNEMEQRDDPFKNYPFFNKNLYGLPRIWMIK